jgi:phosphotransferase system enzyme I (PtsI)
MLQPIEPSAGKPPAETRRILKGIPASPGIAIGKVSVLRQESVLVEERVLRPEEVEAERRRFLQAIARTRRQLEGLRDTMLQSGNGEEARLLETHLLILDDREALESTIEAVRLERRNAEFCYRRVMNRVSDKLEESNSEYFRERTSDLKAVKRRVLRNLLNPASEMAASLNEPHLVFAPDLTPADTAALSPEQLLGFATDHGGRTGHAAILARSRGIPAVVGLANVSDAAEGGELAVVDGTRGIVEISPSPDSLRVYTERRASQQRLAERFASIRSEEAVTKDGVRILLSANVEAPEEARRAVEQGARGIGLLRTEFFFLNRTDPPGEDEQADAYGAAAEAVAPDPVIIRTMDLGGDKLAAYLGSEPGANPFLGLRGIRLMLQHPGLLRSQLRAIYRAAARGNVKIMIPMVSGLEELRIVNRMREDVLRDLRSEGLEHRGEIEAGIMVETPAAIWIADRLAQECDFFSIGSNDLIQYSLAVDRGNERIASLYDPFHPAVLRAIRHVVEAAHAAGIWAGLCGEMASDPVIVPLLVGAGLDELSAGPFFIPAVKSVIRETNAGEARALLDRLLGHSTGGEIGAEARREFARMYPDLAELAEP